MSAITSWAGRWFTAVPQGSCPVPGFTPFLVRLSWGMCSARIIRLHLDRPPSWCSVPSPVLSSVISMSAPRSSKPWQCQSRIRSGSRCFLKNCSSETTALNDGVPK